MKSLLLLFSVCIFSAVGAAAQSSTVGVAMANGYPQMLTIGYDHSEHARQTPLAQEQDLRETSSCTYARGERPLWEVMPISTPKPLGDLARELREERVVGKKAVLVWNNN